MRMLVMPTDVHPTLDTAHSALVEPAASSVYFSDCKFASGNNFNAGLPPSSLLSSRLSSLLKTRARILATTDLRLLDRLAGTEEFAVYVAQMNLLKLPPLLRQVCLPAALPASTLTMANLWVGGHSMKNGLHFDMFDNLLHQVAGSKRALIFPPEDSPHLYYASEGANIRRYA